MSTFENPDAAPGGGDAAPETAEADATAFPPIAETSAAEAAQKAETTRLDGLTPPAETAVAGLESPVPAPAALPPAFTGFTPASDEAPAPGAQGATEAVAATASVRPSGPRTRWAGIIWGLVLAAIAAFGLWILTDADRHAGFTARLLELTPAAVVAYSVLVIGAFALIAGLVGLVRRAQRAGERRRAASALAP